MLCRSIGLLQVCVCIAQTGTLPLYPFFANRAVACAPFVYRLLCHTLVLTDNCHALAILFVCCWVCHRQAMFTRSPIPMVVLQSPRKGGFHLCYYGWRLCLLECLFWIIWCICLFLFCNFSNWSLLHQRAIILCSPCSCSTYCIEGSGALKLILMALFWWNQHAPVFLPPTVPTGTAFAWQRPVLAALEEAGWLHCLRGYQPTGVRLLKRNKHNNQRIRVGLARTVLMFRIWPNSIWWFPCQNTVYTPYIYCFCQP